MLSLIKIKYLEFIALYYQLINSFGENVKLDKNKIS